MPYQTDLPANRYAYLGGPPKPKRAPNAFDSASARILYRGTRAGLDALFAPGSATSGISTTLFTTGLDIEEEENGHIVASVEWKGFVISKDMIFSHAVSARDTQWPQDNGGITIYVPGSYIGKTGNTNPNTGQYWRVRVSDQISGVTVRGWEIAGIYSPPPPPDVGGSGIQQTLGGKPVRPIRRKFSFAGLLDPTYNFPRGWSLRNYDFEETIPLSGGDEGKALYLWTAAFDWNEDYGP